MHPGVQGPFQERYDAAPPLRAVCLGILRETMLRAILTDSHLWAPLLVLGLGLALLLRLI